MPPENVKSEKLVTIFIYRTKSFFGSAMDIDIFIDGKLAAELENGDSISVKVSPGSHEITPASWQGDNHLPIVYYKDKIAQSISHDFLLGETYYIRWKYPSFLQKGTLKLSQEMSKSPFRFVDEKIYFGEK